MNKHVPVFAMDYMFKNETTDDKNNPIFAILIVIHDSCSEGVWAVFTKNKERACEVRAFKLDLEMNIKSTLNPS